MLDEAMEYLLDPPSPSPASEGGQPASQGIRWARKVLEEGSEVLLVDDGSSDGTAEKARELAEMWVDRVEKAGRKVEIRVVRLVKNRGKGGAVQHVSASGPAAALYWLRSFCVVLLRAGALGCALLRRSPSPLLSSPSVFLIAAPVSCSAARPS